MGRDVRGTGLGRAGAERGLEDFGWGPPTESLHFNNPSFSYRLGMNNPYSKSYQPLIGGSQEEPGRRTHTAAAAAETAQGEPSGKRISLTLMRATRATLQSREATAEAASK